MTDHTQLLFSEQIIILRLPVLFELLNIIELLNK